MLSKYILHMVCIYLHLHLEMSTWIYITQIA